jgi:hypothetical protein
VRAGVGFTSALKVALAADTVSIVIMEILDNAIMVAVPGAMDAGITSPLFWVRWRSRCWSRFCSLSRSTGG